MVVNLLVDIVAALVALVAVFILGAVTGGVLGFRYGVKPLIWIKRWHRRRKARNQLWTSRSDPVRPKAMVVAGVRKRDAPPPSP